MSCFVSRPLKRLKFEGFVFGCSPVFVLQSWRQFRVRNHNSSISNLSKIRTKRQEHKPISTSTSIVGEIEQKNPFLARTVVNVFFSFEKEFIRKNIVQRNLITKINRVIRMVLRGLDDVSEIVMRAWAGEGAASTSQAVLSHLARPSLLAPGIQRTETGSRGVGIGWMQKTCTAEPPTAAQTAVPGLWTAAARLPAAHCRGRGQGGCGRGFRDGDIRECQGQRALGLLPRVMVSEDGVLDCLNAEIMIAAVKNVPVY